MKFPSLACRLAAEIALGASQDQGVVGKARRLEVPLASRLQKWPSLYPPLYCVAHLGIGIGIGIGIRVGISGWRHAVRGRRLVVLRCVFEICYCIDRTLSPPKGSARPGPLSNLSKITLVLGAHDSNAPQLSGFCAETGLGTQRLCFISTRISLLYVALCSVHFGGCQRHFGFVQSLRRTSISTL